MLCVYLHNVGLFWGGGGYLFNCSVFLWGFSYTQILNAVSLCHCEVRRPNRCLWMRCAASCVHWRMPWKYLPSVVKTGNPLSKATHYTVLFMGTGYVNRSTQRLVPESRCRICDVMFFHWDRFLPSFYCFGSHKSRRICTVLPWRVQQCEYLYIDFGALEEKVSQAL